jgi:sodium-coupled neutral amino acid transporter 11
MTCDLGVVLEIAGGLSATALAFIVRISPRCRSIAADRVQFPAVAYVALIRGEWYSRAKLPAVVCAAFGAIVLMLSCGLTIKKALTGESSGKVCT